MPVSATHPDYDLNLDDWEMMRDAIAGARVVKDKGEAYLPKPTGFQSQKDNGSAAYEAYKTRAQFPTIVAPTIRGMGGVIHRMDAQIDLPEALEGMREKATKDGCTLEVLHRRITRELLSTGRYGLLADMPSEPAAPGEDDLPFIATYKAETILNWSPDGDFFVLDESALERNGFAWEDQQKFRVLQVIDGSYVAVVYTDEQAELLTPDEIAPTRDDRTTPADDAGGKVSEALAPVNNKPPKTGEDVEDEDAPKVMTPEMRGGKALDKIPFVVIGAVDVRIDVDEIPLLGVGQCAFAIMRLDADYRHQLYMTGQETLTISGGTKEQVFGDKEPHVGAGVIIYLPAEATAQYVGPSGSGIDAHRLAIIDEREHAVSAGAKLIDDSKKSVESGDALRIRFASQTATLTSIAQSSAMGLERVLKHCAEFIGANPDEVVVKPNLSFIEAGLTPKDANELVKVWQSGAISKETLYENLQAGEIASTERSFEEEEAKIQDELPEPGDAIPAIGPGSDATPPPILDPNAVVDPNAPLDPNAPPAKPGAFGKAKGKPGTKPAFGKAAAKAKPGAKAPAKGKKPTFGKKK